MTDTSCKHRDCKYRTAQWYIGMGQGNCNYLFCTGHSRIASLKGKDRLPCNCPYYEPRTKKKKHSNPTGINGYQRIDWDKVRELYDSRDVIGDREIAEIMHIKTKQQVSKWRYKEGLPNKGPRAGWYK